MAIPSPVSAILSMVGSKALARAANRVPDELWSLDATQLERRAGPTAAGMLLRAAFWAGVRTTVADGKKLDLRTISRKAGVSYAHGYELITGDPAFLAWMLQPSIEFRTCSSFLVMDAVEKVHEILSLPTRQPSGELDFNNLNLIVRTVAALGGFYEGFLHVRCRR